MDFILSFLNESFIMQLFLATLLGMLVGAERTLAGKTAGLRTYGLVSLGSCLFVLSIGGLSVAGTVSAADFSRVLPGVITGIGFLGAGLIIFRGDGIVGLTSAAGLWVAAGIGVAVGLNLISLAVAATILTLLVLTVFWFVERGVKGIKDTSDTNE